MHLIAMGSEGHTGQDCIVYLVFEDILGKEGAASGPQLAASAGLEGGSRAALGGSALDRIHAVLLPLALPGLLLLSEHRQRMRVLDDQGCLQLPHCITQSTSTR